MAKSERITFLLNKENPKDKLILDLLSRQYNKSDFIRDILYKVATFNDDNTMITSLSHHDNTITTPLSHDDNAFKVDISTLEDDEVDLSISSSSDPSKNALDFLKDM
ncbi:hypothetical protein [Clostridium paraputrificum]|uniref:hypothetical protein n=1 Tax=Clostridium paraputrificum TaxID=29363 RepID=UPI000C07B65C|nr:hypothetical protein [Clostridium paraputrificum]